MQFLVERYAGRGEKAGGSEPDAFLAIPAPAVSSIRYLGIVRIPDDQTIFHLVEAPDLDALRDALRAARIDYDRIAMAVTDLQSDGSK